MTTKASKLGPGRLTFGEVGSIREFGGQLTKGELKPDTGDTTAVLDGGEVGDDAYTLAGEFYQDYSGMDSLMVWCKTHKGEAIPFEYVPNSAEALGVRGTVTVQPVTFGGEVKKRNTTPFEFKGVGDWDFFDATAGGA